MTKQTFIKAERLTGKTTIDELFSNGESFFCYPYRLAFRILNDEENKKQEFPCRILVNVPKRLHKTAVARNLLKRRIKEAYRLDKNPFYSQLGEVKIQLAVLYTSKDVLEYDILATKLKSALAQLNKKIEKAR